METLNKEVDETTVMYMIGMIVFLFLVLLHIIVMPKQQPIILVNVIPMPKLTSVETKPTENFKPVKNPEQNVNWV